MECSAIVLCGGRGQRVGGVDKGKLPWGDSTLAEQVLGRVRPQVADIIISANRNLAWYETLGHRVVADEREDFQGPLAGLEATLPLCAEDRVLVVSCDMPALPGDLVARLGTALDIAGCAVAYASDGAREHYLAAMLRKSLANSLSRYLDEGKRSVRGWYNGLPCAVADFSDQPEAFLNVNRT